MLSEPDALGRAPLPGHGVGDPLSGTVSILRLCVLLVTSSTSMGLTTNWCLTQLQSHRVAPPHCSKWLTAVYPL